jgi:hypothetical protein
MKTWSHPPGLNRRPADYELVVSGYLGISTSNFLSRNIYHLLSSGILAPTGLF